MKRRFVAVLNIPSPYRLHLIREMARQLDARGIDFHCHFMARGHKGRPASWLNPQIDFQHTYWRDLGHGEFHWNPGLIWHLLWNPPEWLLCGSAFDTFTGIAMMLLTARRSVKIAWVEGNAKRPGELGGLRGWLKRKVLSKCRFVFVPGEQGRKYIDLHRVLTHLTLPQCVVLPNLVDETRFKMRDEYEPDQIARIRARFGCLENTRLCLVPSRLEPVKGVVELFRLLTPEMLEGWRLVVAGEGSLKEEAERALTERGVRDKVVLNDYVPYEEMPLLYAAADLMVLPSLQDQNPLAVVEALHSGLPVAVSDQAGNVDEAVDEGRNGWVLPVFEGVRFQAKLQRLFGTPLETLREMGRDSKSVRASFWTTKTSMKRALDETLG